MWKSSSWMVKPGNQWLEGGRALADPSVSFQRELFSRNSLMTWRWEFPNLKIQCSCHAEQGLADGAWQWESFRSEGRNFCNEYNPDDSGEKKSRWLLLRKSMGLKLQGWAGHMENWQSLLCCCPQQFCPDGEALSILNIGMRAAVSCSHHGKHRKKIHSLASDILHIWEHFLSALSVLWSECKDWLTDVQWTSCGGVLCQAFHQGYKTIGMENEMQNNVLLHFPCVLHILVLSTSQKGLTSLHDIPPAAQYGKITWENSRKKPLALRAFQHFRNTRFMLSSANQWSWTSVNGQD